MTVEEMTILEKINNKSMFVYKKNEFKFDCVQCSPEIFVLETCSCKKNMTNSPCHTPTPIHTPETMVVSLRT